MTGLRYRPAGELPRRSTRRHDLDVAEIQRHPRLSTVKLEAGRRRQTWHAVALADIYEDRPSAAFRQVAEHEGGGLESRSRSTPRLTRVSIVVTTRAASADLRNLLSNAFKFHGTRRRAEFTLAIGTPRRASCSAATRRSHRPRGGDRVLPWSTTGVGSEDKLLDIFEAFQQAGRDHIPQSGGHPVLRASRFPGR